MSLRLRLLAAFAYVLVLVLIALEIPLAFSLSSRVDAEVRAQASAQAQVVAAAAAARLDEPARLRRVAGNAADDLGARVIVVDSRGRLLADSAGGEAATSYASRPEIQAALAGKTAQGTRTSETLGEELLFTAVPVLDDGRRVGAVRVTQSVQAVDDRVRRNVLVLVGVGLIALALGLALAWILAGSLSRPLRGLARTARRVEEGELDARAEVTGATEQREVALAFNDMTDRLAQVLAAQREFVANASHQLRTPLTGLRLRLEAAGLKADDPELERELQAAEAEVERLTQLLNSLLTLAREGDRPRLRAPTSLRESLRGGGLSLGRPGCAVGAPARARARAGHCRPGGRGGRGDHPRQPARERARLLAGRDRGHARLGRVRPPRRRGRGAGGGAGRGAARVRAVPSRPP